MLKQHVHYGAFMFKMYCNTYMYIHMILSVSVLTTISHVAQLSLLSVASSHLTTSDGIISPIEGIHLSHFRNDLTHFQL